MIAINTVNVDACKRLIKACTAIGFLKDPRIEEARNISYGLSPADLLSLKMTKALPLGNVKALQEFLKEAADMKPMPLQNEVVEQVKDYLATQLSGGAVPTDISKFKDLDFNTTMRLNRTKQINPTTYANFIASKGQYPLSEVTFTSVETRRKLRERKLPEQERTQGYSPSLADRFHSSLAGEVEHRILRRVEG